MANLFSDGNALLITITNIVDAQGQPATLTAKPTWATSDPTILNPTPAADGLSATGTALKTGAVTITVTSGTLPPVSVVITIGAGQAVSFQLSVALASIQPPPPPPPPPPVV
jgi:hypothetical protein